MLPEGWRETTLGKCLSVMSGYAFKSDEFCDYGIPVIRISNITDTFDIDLSDCVYHADMGDDFLYIAKEHDVLIAMSGATTGKIGVYRNNEIAYINQRVGKICVNDSISNLKYFFYVLNQDEIQEYISRESIGGAQPNISNRQISIIKINIPPLPEQEKIAAILSTWDKAISTTDALLANSRQQKKALMQQLLTGKRRLPGFTEKWNNCQFRNIFSILSNTPLSRAEVEDSEEVEYVHYGDIHKISASYLDFAQDHKGKISSNKVKSDFLEDGDLLVVDASEDFEGIGKAVEVKNIQGKKAVAGLHTILARPDKTLLEKGYAGKIQFIPSVKKQFISLATGISVFGLSKTNFLSVSVLIPPLDEQRAIAAVLDAADREIVLLEQKAARLREEKKALMQQLLTGKRRVRV